MRDTVIFLDIDYVLNDNGTKDRFGPIIGVEGKKIRLLKEIVDFLDADIILSSSWNDFWEKDITPEAINRNPLLGRGKYLDERLSKRGLKIEDKTPLVSWRRRAIGVLCWLKEHPEVKRFIIIDDADLDWKRYGLEKHWICTYGPGVIGYDGGLEPKHVSYIKEHVKDFEREPSDDLDHVPISDVV